VISIRPSFEEVAPHFVEARFGTLIACGSQRLKDCPNDLAWPAKALRCHTDQCPVVACEFLVSVNITVPLTAVRPMLITFILDNDLEGDVDKVNSTDWAFFVSDDEVALWCWQAR
jgi:hypothetical protein